MIRIPSDRLSSDALYSIAEFFVLREGTDYGDVEQSLQDKVERLLKQVERGEVIVSYEEATESCNLMTRHEAQINGIL